MKTNFEIHPIQAKALKVLLFNPSARFSQLNKDKVPTDQFNFHLKALICANIIEKQNQKYCLTYKGKELAGRMDTEAEVIERQAKISLAIVPVKKVGKTRLYLVHQRLKQPYYGYYGAINGKIHWGEKVMDAAKRELFEETGLVAEEMTMLGVFHKSDYAQDGKLLEDKFFFRVRVDKFSGELKEVVAEGKNYWLTQEQVAKLDKTYKHFPKFLAEYDKDRIEFAEMDFLAEGY